MSGFRNFLYHRRAQEILGLQQACNGVTEDPDFIKAHLAHAIGASSHHCLIFTGSHFLPLSADFDLVDRTNSASLKELADCPFEAEDAPITLRGSFNGLVCLSNANGLIVLWNPLTKNFKKLPEENIETPSPGCQMMEPFYGFGYDPVTEDYKVVRIVQYLGDNDNNKQVKVYSLKSDLWVTAQSIPHFIVPGNGTLATNALHWVFKENNPSEIYGVTCFDLGGEVFNRLTLPPFSDGHPELNLGVLRKCLCLVATYDESKKADIWIMKDDGVALNWIVLVSLSLPHLDSGVSFPRLRPIAYSSCGKRVLLKMDSNGLVWINPEGKSTAHVVGQGHLLGFDLDVCVHSLVQPNREYSRKRRKRDDSHEIKCDSSVVLPVEVITEAMEVDP